MAIRRKTVLAVVILVAALIVVAILVVPALADLDRYRPQAIAYLEAKTGKPVKISRLALTIFPTVSIRADDPEIGNPPGFPPGAFVTAQRIYAEVDAGALWNRQVVIKSLELDTPVINLLSDPRGHWNFESPAGESAARPVSQPPANAAPGGAPSFTLGVIAKLKISGGQLTVGNVLPSRRPGEAFFVARGVAATLEQFDFDAFAGSGSSSAGAGTLTADSLRFGAVEATSVRSKLSLGSRRVAFNGLTFNIDGGHAGGNLAFNFAGADTHFTADTQLSGVDMARLLDAFPSGRGKMTGTLEGNTRLAGAIEHSDAPLAGITGGGALTVRNGKLPSLKLSQNLTTLARLGSLGPAAGDPSSFSELAADFRLADQRISSQKITVVGNGVDAQGSGTLSLPGAGTLDYQGVANIAAGQNALTNVVAGLSGATLANGKLSFPFHVGGTLDDPKFNLQSKGGINSLSNLAGALPGGQKPASSSNLVDTLGKL